MMGPGALSEIGFFCPQTISVATNPLNATLFQETALSTDLARILDDSGFLPPGTSESCLNSGVQVSVAVQEASSLPTLAALKCGVIEGTVWTASPTEFVSAILNADCTPGLSCLFSDASNYTACQCGSNDTFECTKKSSPITTDPILGSGPVHDLRDASASALHTPVDQSPTMAPLGSVAHFLACEIGLFETLIALHSENPAQCTGEEMKAIQEVLNTTYNEAIITLNQSSLQVDFTASLCLDIVIANESAGQIWERIYKWKAP